MGQVGVRYARGDERRHRWRVRAVAARQEGLVPAGVGRIGESVATCKVPQGAYLLISPGGFECSKAEGNGSTRRELLAGARAGFAGITAASVTVRGHEYKHLKRFVKVSPMVQLPGPNLFGPDAGPSLTKGYFLFIKPLRPGHHTVSSYVKFADGFEGGITYDIEVVKKSHS